MLNLHRISSARMLGLAVLVLYSVYAFASGVPGIGTAALAVAVIFGRAAVTAPKPVQAKEISVSATILICAGATLLFGLLVKPLGPLSLIAFMLPVAAVAYWQFDLRGRQALLVASGFLLALVSLVALVLAT